MQNPILSIFIPTYNHERYIAQTLDSVLMQKTDYPLEILIGEDCSVDGTRKILREYEIKYPGKFQMFYRKHNMYQEKINNALDLLLRCKGKYIIALEGDDFWTDPYKLDKQISFLEKHQEYYAVAHNCIVVNDDSIPNGEKYPECKDLEYTYRHYFNDILPGQTATVMFYNYLNDKDFNNDYPSVPVGTPGDRIFYYKLLVNDKKIYCMQEVMSAYRHVTNFGTSFSATYKAPFEKEEPWYKAKLIYTQKYKREWLDYAKILYLQMLYSSLREKKINVKTFFEYFKQERLYTVVLDFINCKIKKRLIRKKFYV